MIHPSVIERIAEKTLGRREIYPGDCATIAEEIRRCMPSSGGISESTLKRMFGMVGMKTSPHVSTLDILARYLGSSDYKSLLSEMQLGDYASEFACIDSITPGNLTPEIRIRMKYDPSRTIEIVYRGCDEFEVESAVNTKLQKGDRLHLSSLTAGQELIITDVVRNGRSLGGYRAAKNGGLTFLEII